MAESENHDQEQEQDSVDSGGDGQGDAIFVYYSEETEKYVGIYHTENHVFQSLGDTNQEAVRDMIETINNLPQALLEVQNGEAHLVDVMPLREVSQEEGDD